MTLKDLLKPFKAVDEQILKQYSKLTKKWEDKGRGRYSLSNLFNIPSFIVGLGGYNTGWVHGWNFSNDNIVKAYGKDFNVQENSSKVEDGNPIIKAIDRATRMPLLITGIGFAGTGLYEVISGLYSGDNQCIPKGFDYLSTGISFIGGSSSQYVKDSNPKLLDKKPFWKTTYEKVRDKVKDLVPEQNPFPAPAPIGNYSTLEEYVK